MRCWRGAVGRGSARPTECLPQIVAAENLPDIKQRWSPWTIRPGDFTSRSLTTLFRFGSVTESAATAVSEQTCIAKVYVCATSLQCRCVAIPRDKQLQRAGRMVPVAKVNNSARNDFAILLRTRDSNDRDRDPAR